METASFTDAVRYLSKSFRGGVSLRAALDSTSEKFGCLAWSTPEAQKQLLNETVFYTEGLPKHGMRFPFGATRCARFVRLLMDEIDRLDKYEVDEEVAEHAAEFCQRKVESYEKFAYVMYELRTEAFMRRTRNVVIRVSGRFNELGHRVWEAGVMLCAELMDEESEVRKWFNGRRVLELGAGTGVSAAGYAEAGVEYALMTDHDEDVVANMKYNIETNCSGTGCIESCVVDAENVKEVMQIANERKIDTIVGADVNYDEDVVACMVNALAEVVIGDRVGLVVVTERSEAMVEILWRKLEDGGLDFEKVEWAKPCERFEYLLGWEFSRVSMYRIQEGNLTVDATQLSRAGDE